MSSGIVEDMVVDTINNFLYIGGVFSYVGDSIYSRDVAMFDGFQWHSLDNGVVGGVLKDAMAIYHGDLYVGGTLSETTNGLELNCIGRWDGTQWHDLQGGCAGAVMALQVFQDTLIVGGAFYQVGLGEEPQRALALAKWYMPETGCNYLQPVLHAYEEYGIPQDTFYIEDGQAEVHFYNNNAYADSWQWDFGDGGTSDVQEPVHTYTNTGEYEVSVTVTDDGCEKTASKTVHIRYPVGIDDKKLPVMSLYPNPTEGNFILELENNALLSQAGKLTLEVSNMQGQHVYSTAIHQRKTTIPSSTWPRGTYICKLYHTGNLLSSDKMVLE
ncbi:MAG: PKD domain-containing protein [Bacteroidales bacterium]